MATSVRELAACSRTIIVAVYSGEQVEALFGEIDDGAGAARPVVICITTCGPGEIIGIAERASRAGLPLLEAPISGTSIEVLDGTATALLAGDDAIIDQVGGTPEYSLPAQPARRRDRRCQPGQTRDQFDPAEQPRSVGRGISVRRTPGARWTRIPGGGAAIGRLFPRHGLQGREDVDAGLSAAVTYRADIEGCRVDHRASGAMRHASPTHHHSGRTFAHAIALEGPDRDSAAVIEAIRRPPASPGVLR